MFVVATGISYSFSESRRDGMFPGHTMSSLRVGEGKKGGEDVLRLQTDRPSGTQKEKFIFQTASEIV